MTEGMRQGALVAHGKNNILQDTLFGLKPHPRADHHAVAYQLQYDGPGSGTRPDQVPAHHSTAAAHREEAEASHVAHKQAALQDSAAAAKHTSPPQQRV